MSIRRSLALLVLVFLVGFAVFGVAAYRGLSGLSRHMEQVEVNGPLYQRIVQGKDLIADILPPPAYLIESYLTCLQ